MKRMLLCEFAILGSSLRQLLSSAAVILIVWIFAFQSLVKADASAVFMITFMLIMTSASIADKNDLTMLPLPRRDVVLGRYACLLLMILLAALAPSALCALIMLASTLAPLSAPLAALLAADADPLISVCAISGLGLFMGAIVTSVCLPVFFKLGATGATLFLPVAVSLVMASPLLLFRIAGDAAVSAAMSAVTFAFTPVGAAVTVGGAAVVVIVALTVSALISIRLFERREL